MCVCFWHPGVWGVGVATQKMNLNQVPMGRDTHSLVLRHDGSVYHNNEEKNRLPANSLPQEGDVVVSVCVCVYGVMCGTAPLNSKQHFDGTVGCEWRLNTM